MRCRNSFVTLAALLAGTPATAGVILHEVQEQSGESFSARGSSALHTEMELSAEGDGMRSDILKSDSPLTPTGSYMLFPNDEVFYIVNPANKTYTLMDMAAMAGAQQMGRPTPQQPNGGSTGAQDLVMEKKLDEAGPLMLGLPTQHVVYEISYHRPPPAQIPGFITSMEVHERYEIWATHGLDAQAANVPALNRPAARMGGAIGAPQLKQVGEALASHGFILKQIVTVESKTGGATGPIALFMHSSHKQSTSSVVTAIRYENLQPERFVLPQGYTEVGMMNANMGAMPDLSKLPGRPGGPPQTGGSSQAGAPPPPASGQPPQMPDLNSIPK